MRTILLLVVSLFFITSARADSLPPKLGSEQVIFLAYKLAGEKPPFSRWAEADGRRSAEELERLYRITEERTDLSRFHRDLELALYGYDPGEGRVPLGEIKAAFLTSPIKEIAGVEVHIENADNFAYWNLTPEQYRQVVEKNDNNEHYNYISTMTVKGVDKTKPRNEGTEHVLNVHWDKLYIYTKDRSKLLATFEAK